MYSTTGFIKNFVWKEKGLGGENFKHEAKPIRDVGDAWKLEQTQNKQFKLPTKDLPPISPYIELRDAEKHLQRTEERLERKRRELVLKQENLKSQWLELASRERGLRDNFILFSKFLKTNLEKRERTWKKIQTDRENSQNRTAQIDELRKSYERRLSSFQILKDEIEKHSIYQTFLEEVVESTEGSFKDIEDIPKQMEVLLLTKEKLQKRQSEQLSSLECSKRVMAQFMEAKKLQLIGISNKMASLEYAYDAAVNRTVTLDNLIVNLKTTITEYAKDISVNKEGIQNIYRQICMRNRITGKQRNREILSQLMVINRTLESYRKITELLKRKSSKGPRFTRKFRMS